MRGFVRVQGQSATLISSYVKLKTISHGAVKLATPFWMS